jgi:hypothetical protein
VGLGYRFKDVIFTSRLAENPSGIIKGDINIKGDLSYRNNQTIVRYLDYDKSNWLVKRFDARLAEILQQFSFMIILSSKGNDLIPQCILPDLHFCQFWNHFLPGFD